MGRVLMWPVWWLAVLATIATGAFFGHQATSSTWSRDPGDLVHVVAAGGYVASAVTLFLAAVALEAFHGPKVARRLAVMAAAVFVVLAARAAFILNGTAFNEDPGAFPDGLTEPVSMPWAWLLLLTGFFGWIRIYRDNRSTEAESLPERVAA